MTEGSHDVQPHELQSDLDLLIEMVKDLKEDDAKIHRHLESLKTKLDKFIHKHRRHSGGDSGS